MSIEEHMDGLGKIPMLTADEEIILGCRVQEMMKILQKHEVDAAISQTVLNQADFTEEERVKIKKGIKARNRMISANMRLVASVANKMLPGHIHMTTEDMIQEGAIGLARAVEKFDPARGYKFSTYAYWWIRQSISRAGENQELAIRVPTNVQRIAKRASEAKIKLSLDLNREPSFKEIADSIEEGEPEKVRRAVLASARMVSLDYKLGDNSERDASTLLDLIANGEEQCRDAEDAAAKVDFVMSLIAYLPESEQLLIKQKYGIGTEPVSTQQLAEMIGISHQAVRTRHGKILNKIRFAATIGRGFC